MCVRTIIYFMNSYIEYWEFAWLKEKFQQKIGQTEKIGNVVNSSAGGTCTTGHRCHMGPQNHLRLLIEKNINIIYGRVSSSLFEP